MYEDSAQLSSKYLFSYPLFIIADNFPTGCAFFSLVRFLSLFYITQNIHVHHVILRRRTTGTFVALNGTVGETGEKCTVCIKAEYNLCHSLA